MSQQSPLTQRSFGRHALADATGRTDEEVALALTVGAAAAALMSAMFYALRLLDYLEDLSI